MNKVELNIQSGRLKTEQADCFIFVVFEMQVSGNSAESNMKQAVYAKIVAHKKIKTTSFLTEIIR